MTSGSFPVKFDRVGETIPSAKWYWDLGMLEDYDLILILGGNGSYSDAKSQWQVSPGSCMLLRKGEHYIGTQDPESPLSMIFIHFDYLNKKKNAANLPAHHMLPLHFRVERFDFVRTLARCVLESQQSLAINHHDGPAHAWFRVLWLELSRQVHNPRWLGAESDQAAQIEAICNLLRSQIGRRWRLSDIATRIGCTPEHARRLFHKYQGVSPGEFIIRTRMEVAQALLSSSSQSISQIAETLGFCDVYAFSSQFRKRIGVSPKKYRK